MPYEPGQILLDKYRIESLVGRGAFAEVYHATHLSLNAPRALKVLRRDAPGLGSTEYSDFRQRFQLEAQLGAQLDHPHVIRIYDFEQDGDTLILVMEYAERGSLAEVLARMRQKNQSIPVQGVVRIARDVAEGLAALHAVDVVHRDLKPSNILFDAQGHAKIADLGLAQIPHGPSMRSQLSQPQPHPGTPAYMSPEQQSSGKYLTPASDVYAVGLVLFEMLTGRAYKNVRPHTRVQELRSDVPAWFADLTAQMLNDDPASRPWDGAEILKLLKDEDRHAPAAEPIHKTVRTPSENKPIRKWRWLIAIIMFILVVLAVILANVDPSILAFIYASTPTATPTFTSTPTNTPTPTSTNTPTPTPTDTPTPTPTDTPTPTPTDTPTPTPTPTPKPPTITPKPPTITPKPPTITPKPPTITPKPPTITPRPPTITPEPPTITPIPTTPPPTTPPPTITRYYVVDQEVRACGESGHIDLSIMPVSKATPWWVYVQKCSGETFSKSGRWYLRMDGVRRFGPFYHTAGELYSYVELFPSGSEFLGYHTYDVELYAYDSTNPLWTGDIVVEGRLEY